LENGKAGQDEADSTTSTATPVGQGAVTPSPPNNGNLSEPLIQLEDQEAEEEEATNAVLAVLSRPFDVVFQKTIPGEDTSAVWGFAVSMIWLCVLSYGALMCTASFSDVCGLSKATAGVTLLAWGGQLPDAIAAVALARRGMPDEAISQAIASQVINVSIGLGLPFFTYTCLTGEPSTVTNPGAVCIVALTVLGSIVAYLLCMVLGLPSWRDVTSIWGIEHCVATISTARAFMLATFFVIFYVGAIYVSEVEEHVRA